MTTAKRTGSDGPFGRPPPFSTAGWSACGGPSAGIGAVLEPLALPRPRRRSPRSSERLPPWPVNPSSVQTDSSGCGASSAGHAPPGASQRRNPSLIGQSPGGAWLTLTASDRARTGISVLAPATKSRPFAASAGVRHAVCQRDGRDLPRPLCQNAPKPVRTEGRAIADTPKRPSAAHQGHRNATRRS